MTYGPGIPPDPPRNKHRWADGSPGFKRCDGCGIMREVAWALPPGDEPRWCLNGQWYDGPIPPCVVIR